MVVFYNVYLVAIEKVLWRSLEDTGFSGCAIHWMLFVGRLMFDVSDVMYDV